MPVKILDKFGAVLKELPVNDLFCADLRGVDLYHADLSGANLSGADLGGANLRCVDLSGANLFRADLSCANLSCANSFRADLSGADLRGADLRGANLNGANLSGANLSGANLSGANLSGAKINWNSHSLISAILLQNAGSSTEKRMAAGLIAVSTDWCWKEFENVAFTESIRLWIHKTLSASVTKGDEAPSILTSPYQPCVIN